MQVPYIPTPVPTPLPPAVQNQITQTASVVAEQVVDAALQERAVGILLLVFAAMAIAVLVVAVGWTLKQWANRNRPTVAPKEDVEATGLVTAVSAMSGIVERVEANRKAEHEAMIAREEKRDKEFAAERENLKLEIKQITSGYQLSVEKIAKDHNDALSGLSGGFLKVAGIGGQTNTSVGEIVTKLETMANDINEIKTKLLPCPEIEKVIDSRLASFLDRIKTDLKVEKINLEMGIQEEKRKTSGDSKPIPAIDPTQLGATA